jgi:hypothetical protein
LNWRAAIVAIITITAKAIVAIAVAAVVPVVAPVEVPAVIVPAVTSVGSLHAFAHAIFQILQPIGTFGPWCRLGRRHLLLRRWCRLALLHWRGRWRGNLALWRWWRRDLLCRLGIGCATAISPIAPAFTALAAFATPFAPAFSAAFASAFAATALAAFSVLAVATALALSVLSLRRRRRLCEFDQRRVPVCRDGGRRLGGGKREGDQTGRGRDAQKLHEMLSKAQRANKFALAICFGGKGGAIMSAFS